MGSLDIVVAYDDTYGIGRFGTIPWPDNKLDTLRFRYRTKDTVVVMGSKTWDSLPRRPLKHKRVNCVLSSQKTDLGPEVHVIDSFEKLDEFLIAQTKHVNIVGGASLFDRYMTPDGDRPMAKYVYVTRIGGNHGCDVFFPHEKLIEFYEMRVIGRDDGGVFEVWRSKRL